MRPYLWYNHSTPIIIQAHVFDNGCKNSRSGSFAQSLNYEWSFEHQQAFEEVMLPALDVPRWEGLVSELRTQWPNALDKWTGEGTPWLAALAPGVEVRLHELGKTLQFRDLRMWEPEFDEAPSTRPVTLNDPRVEGLERLPSHSRATYIASRGMVQLYSKRFPDVYWKPMTCPICLDLFWPDVLSSIDIARAGLPRYCPKCVNMIRRDVWGLGQIDEAHLRPMLITIVQSFYEMTGIFPFQKIKSMPIGEFQVAERDKLARLLMLVPSPDVAEHFFGSWQKYLNEAGLLDEAPRKGHSGYVTIAADGHLALSIGERIICDWLHSHGIEHEKEPHYPTHPELNPGGKLRADWLIGDCWVEFAGRMNNPTYAAKIGKKQELAQGLGLRHLVLLPPEVNRLEAIATEHWAWPSRG